ncbi:MAG TPA: 23S rRNA (adenine(2503)-C(2))-methyltransferase RlmN [Bdellovibrionales bacterium]|nr:23S rRNA (adenine(2503)-C(2))-methyltransferase RlmN [Bdellovibrionales bacterium]
MEKLKFFSLTLPELTDALKGLGKQGFRGQQLYRWIYGEGEQDFEKMTNFSKEFRKEAPELFDFSLPEVIKVYKSIDGTTKMLFNVGSGKSVEAVLIPSSGRITLCISSEVGCNMACKFCYTGKQKLQRRLETWEIVGQFVQAARALEKGRRITNIVFMGMGEPLDNADAVFKSVEILHSTWGYNVSRKRVTISTSGIVPMIPRVTEAGVRLAVSLNAVNDQVRSEIMPINKRWPIEELLEACRVHCRETGDKVTLEYVLLKGVTDSVADARELARITRDVPSKINIIPFNEHPDSGFQRPSEDAIVRFQNELIRLGCHVLRRKTMGRDIYAACGQLTTAVKKANVNLEMTV